MGKSIFCRKTFETIVERMAIAPDSQLSEKLRNECRSFEPQNKTSSEIYDFLVYLSKQPETEASRFVKATCDVSRYYKRPEE